MPSFNIVFSGPNITKRQGIKFLMPISIGLHIHEAQRDEKLKCILAHLAEQYEKAEVLIVVADTLYRYTLPQEAGDTEDSREARAAALGEDWILRYSQMIHTLNDSRKIKIAITRWNDYLRDEAYASCQKTVEGLYCASGSSFKESIDRTAKKFFSTSNDVTTPPQDQLQKNCLYLKEEAAIFSLWVLKFPCQYILYPTKKTDALKVCYDYLIEDDRKHLFQFEQIKFQREKKEKSSPSLHSSIFSPVRRLRPETPSSISDSDAEQEVAEGKKMSAMLTQITTALMAQVYDAPPDLRPELTKTIATFTSVLMLKLLEHNCTSEVTHRPG